MHRLTFHPLGNADSLLIELENGRLLVVDYAHVKSDSKDDLRYDLKAGLTNRLNELKRTDVDVFCPTHLDNDHICGASDFFYLEHAAKYQTEGRFKIKDLWVPAGAITEEGCEDAAKVWRAEARHRLKAGTGIRVFGRPDRLKDWMKENGLDFDSRKHLITDAGRLIPGFSLASDSVEFFLHSPHAHRINDREVEDRNQDCVVMQATFQVSSTETRVMMAGDTTWEAMVDIVNITKFHKNDSRLDYDVFKLPHHCSYLSLSDDKGKTKTVPKPEIEDWYDRGARNGILISSSDVIRDVDSNMPPHFQARNYYEDVRSAINGFFKVTMEHPSALSPKPLVIEISHLGPMIKNAPSGIGAAASLTAVPPKAG